MSTIKKFNAIISTGVYNTLGYQCKVYTTLQGFKRALKSKHCPFTPVLGGCIMLDGLLRSYRWSYAGLIYKADILT